MKCYASDVLRIAQNEIGYKEKKSKSKLDDKTANAGTANYTKYGRDFDEKYPNFYNGKKNGYAWCDQFVDWCFVTAFGVKDALRLLCQPEKSLGAGCTYSLKYYEENNQLFDTPEVGDQIFFSDTSNKNKCSHTGLVYDVDRTSVYTIEGNTSNEVAIRVYKLGDKKIVGYGRPAYDEEPVEEIKNKVITTANLNCRYGPSRNTKVIKVYKKSTVLEILQVSNNWGKTTEGWVCLNYTKPVDNIIFVGSKVKVKEGSKSYTGNRLSKSVYSNIYDVIQINKDRVVIGIGKSVTAAMNIKDLILN